MSSFYTNISENAERVIDPISQQVIYALVRKLGAQDLFKDRIHIQNDRSANSLYNNTDRTRNFLAENRMDVTVDTHYNPAESQMFDNSSMGVNTPAIAMNNHNKYTRRSIFSDPKIGFYVRELNMPFTITFNVEMRFSEYDGAMRVLSNILNEAHSGLINDVHDVVYSYPFDRSTWMILTAIFNARESYRKNNPNATILEYLDSISKAQWGFDIRRPDLTETAVAKADTEAAVTRQQLSCAAKLEYSGSKPEPVMEESQPVGYTIEFTYTIQVGRPHLLEFDVPPIVEQNPLPAIFFTPRYNTDDPKVSGHASVPSMTQMMYNAANGSQYRTDLFKMPEYDTWATPSTSLLRKCKFFPVIEAVVALDGLGVETKVDLTQLGEAKIADWVLEILGQMTTDQLLNYNGIFNVTIFADDTPLDHSFVKWDPETKIISFIGKKKETVYRLVFSEASSLTYIDAYWKDTLIKYKQYVPCALMRTMGYLSQVGVLHLIGDKSLMTYVSKALSTGKLKAITESMIQKGAPVRLRGISTPKEYVSYICNTPFLNRRFTLYDLFVQTAKDLNLLSSNDTFGRQIQIDSTYNYDFTVGGLPNGHNEPLRVFDTNITRAQ